MTSEHIIDAKGVEFAYSGDALILKDVGLELNRSEILGVLGPNGSGKTTFIKCLNKVLIPSQGEILLNGEDVREMKRRDVARKVGLVPQNSETDIASPFVYDVVMMGRKPHMTWQFTEKDEKIVWEIMTEFDVAHLASRHFNELSSGQTQRVLIARAVAQDADVLLLDEPTSNLDVKYQMDVMNIIRGIVDSKKVSACAIIHDLDLAMKYCDKIVLLNDGKVVSSGTPLEALTTSVIRDVYGVESHVEYIHGRNRVLID